MGNLSCDICGREDVRAVILIEGAKMLACGGCVRSGKVIHWLVDEEKSEGTREVILQKRKAPFEDSKEIVDGYGNIIKRARDRMRVPISVIAEKLNEKESYLDAIENERLKPSLKVAKKLEKELSIKLIEDVERSVGPSIDSKSQKFSEPTLADALFDAKKKKES